MSTKQANPAKPLVLREPIKLAQVNPRVMTLMQDTTLTKQANQAKPLVLLERLAVRLVRFLALMPCQAIMCQFRANQVQQHAQLDLTKAHPESLLALLQILVTTLIKRENQVKHNAQHQPTLLPRAVPLPYNAFQIMTVTSLLTYWMMMTITMVLSMSTTHVQRDNLH